LPNAPSLPAVLVFMRHLVHPVVSADGAHGLVLGGSGCLYRCCSRRYWLATATAGFLFQKGALDFAGGTVVHINAAVAGLVGAYMVGKRDRLSAT
jgi:ammonia channel protein AmtB